MNYQKDSKNGILERILDDGDYHSKHRKEMCGNNIGGIIH